MKVLKISILLFAFMLLFMGCSNQEILKENEPEKQTVENKSNDVPQADEYTADRPEQKEVTWLSEGTEYTENFQLVDAPTIPFTTYMLKDDSTIITSDNKVTINWNNIGYIEVEFFPEKITEEEVMKNIKGILNEYSENEKVEKDSSTWIKSFYYIYDREGDIDTWRSAYVLLGQRNEQYFIIYWHLDDMEKADIFGGISDAVYREWRWKDKDESLTYPF